MANDITQVKVGTTTYDINALKVTYTETLPSNDHDSGSLGFVVTSTEPASTDRKARWLYIVTED